MSEIVVRHVETADAQALHQLYSQPKAYRDTLHLPLHSIESWHQRLANLEPGTHSLVACIDGQIVYENVCFYRPKAFLTSSIRDNLPNLTVWHW